jgi:predicted nucleotidyltransferase component of viral defense system
MENTKILMKNLLAESSPVNKIFQRNLLKEYLQVLVLDFIYSHKKYSQLVFYGGSCLAHCHNLPRLSEDLDFVDLKKKIKLTELAKDLAEYFKDKTDLKMRAVTQKFRVYLKFFLLHDLGLATKSESDLLFLKVEIFKSFDFCKNYQTEIVPLFKFNRSILVKTFDLPTLMSTKIRAILHRKWEKTDQTGKILARVKGRDYFDLIWYLEKGIKPNLGCLKEVKDERELQEKLLNVIKRVDSRSIRFDLEPLIADANLVKNLSRNLKDILKRYITDKFETGNLCL